MKELAAFTKALERLRIDVGMNPGDPASVDAAIREMESEIDAAARRYSRNKAVQALAANIKKMNAKGIIEEARKAERQGQ